MTGHAEVYARQAGARSEHNSTVTLVAFDSDFVDVMNIVRELDRLLRFGLDVEEVFGSVSVAGMRRRECRRTPPPRRIRVCDSIRVPWYFGLLYTTKERRNKTEQRHPPGERIAVDTMPLHCSQKKIRSVLTLVRPLFLYFLGESIRPLTPGSPRAQLLESETYHTPSRGCNATPPPSTMLECFGSPRGVAQPG